MTLSDTLTRRAEIDRLPQPLRWPFMLNLKADVLEAIAEGECESPVHAARVVMLPVSS